MTQNDVMKNVATKLQDLNLTDRILFDETMESRDAWTLMS